MMNKFIKEIFFEKFFANYNDAVLGNIELWFNEIKDSYYVIAVNN